MLSTKHLRVEETITLARGRLHVRLAAYLDSGALWEMYVFREEGVIERVEIKSGEKLLHLVWSIGRGHAGGAVVEERVVVVVGGGGEGDVGGRGPTLFMPNPGGGQLAR